MRQVHALGATALLAGLLWMTSMAPASAQQGPIRLTPPANDVERTPTPPALPPGPSGRRDTDDQPVAVGRLDTIDPSTAGTIGEHDGGFSPQLWRGIPRERVEVLLARLPAPVRSAPLRELAQRLLQTAAAVPEGPGKAASLLGLRAERLFALGLTNEALAVAQLAPPSLRDPLLDQVLVDGALLIGDILGACRRVDLAIGAGAAGPFWLKRLAYCRAIAGERDAARLAADLLRELAGLSDEQFFVLMAPLLGEAAPRLGSLTDASPLVLAMLRSARLDIPASAIRVANVPTLRAIASAPSASIEVRLAAAEAAEGFGTLSADALTQLYRSLPTKPEELASAIKTAEATPGPRANALLFQAAAAETTATGRAAAIRAALAAARAGRNVDTIARSFAPIVAEMEPTPELTAFAGDAGLILFAAGQVASARKWFEFARSMTLAAQPDAARAVIDLWPLFLLVDGERPLQWDPAILLQWKDGLGLLPVAKRRSRAEVFLVALASAGKDVDPSSWAAIFEGSIEGVAPVPSAAVLRALKSASEAGRLGETIVHALIVLGDQGLETVQPAVLEAVLQALHKVGLANEAQAIAVDALLGQTK
ncbi:MAG: hypothetical protein EXQ85_07625 [Alphaproteobacteria bacterium]|nr:hypothetical protein [Alphaproteobacteria bacterium]